MKRIMRTQIYDKDLISELRFISSNRLKHVRNYVSKMWVLLLEISDL